MSMDTTRFNTFALFLVSIACTVALSGCFGEEMYGPYDGPDKIAFEFDLLAEAQASDQPATLTVPEPVTSSDTTITLGTELIGPQRSSDVQVNYGISEETVEYVKEFPADTGGVARETTILARATTAQEGTHYQIDGSYTFPANASAASFDVTVMNGIPEGGDPVRVALRLDGNEANNLQPAETMRYLTINIQPRP